MLKSWGRGVYKARWYIVVLWLLILVAGAMGAKGLNSVLSGGGTEISGSMSEQANELMSTQFPGRSDTALTLLVRNSDHEAGTPTYNEKLEQVIAHLQTEEGVSKVFSILDASSDIRQGMIGTDNHVSVAFVDMDVPSDHLVKKMPEIQQRLKVLADSLGVEAYLLGQAAYQGETDAQSERGLARAEMLVFPLILFVLLFAYRSVVATLTSLFTTLASIIVAMGIIDVVANQVELSVFVTNSAMMLGLGVGVDYSLFIISRYKQEIESNPKAEAVVRTVQTAGHTVLYSAITVIAALSALFIVRMPAIQSIAFGGIAVVIVAGLVSLTLLPALLGILGTRINKFTIPILQRSSKKATDGHWQKWTRMVMRRPVIFLTITLGLLLVISAPALNMKLYSPDFRILPNHAELRNGFEALEQSFGNGAASPVNIVLYNDEEELATSESLAKIAELQGILLQESYVEAVTSVATFFTGVAPDQAAATLNNGRDALPRDVQIMLGRFLSEDNRTAVIEVKLDDYGSSEASREFVKKLRDRILPGFAFTEGTKFVIGGETMSGIETSKEVTDKLLPSLAIMLGLIYIILLFTFKSVLLPIKAIVLNLISVSATFGILVFVFANGHGSEIFDVSANGYIIHFVPILLLALLFGLSTDYEVFLVTRIKEEYELTGNHERSIETGMAKTGPLISGAALLMLAVFAGFAFSGVLPIQMLGFGMAVAILLDATVIRLLLVPVSMKLLGKLSWWKPGR